MRKGIDADILINVAWFVDGSCCPRQKRFFVVSSGAFVL